MRNAPSTISSSPTGGLHLLSLPATRWAEGLRYPLQQRVAPLMFVLSVTLSILNSLAAHSDFHPSAESVAHAEELLSEATDPRWGSAPCSPGFKG